MKYNNYILEDPSNEKDDYIRGEKYDEIYLIAIDPEAPIDLLEKLCYLNDEYIISTVLTNPNCTDHLFEKLSNNDNFAIRRCIAESENCPIYILERFVENDNIGNIRNIILSNNNCPIYLLEKFSKSRDCDIIRNIVFNYNCPLEILDYICKQQDTYFIEDNSLDFCLIKEMITNHPNCTIDILRLLSDENYYYNKHIPEFIIKGIILNKISDFDLLKKLYKKYNYLASLIEGHCNWSLKDFI